MGKERSNQKRSSVEKGGLRRSILEAGLKAHRQKNQGINDREKLLGKRTKGTEKKRKRPKETHFSQKAVEELAKGKKKTHHREMKKVKKKPIKKKGKPESYHRV